MKRVDGKGIAMLLDLDGCIGCYGCESACRETHRYSYDEEWMKTIRRDPVLVEGRLRLYHLVAPTLDKCRECYDKDPTPLCVKSCPAGSLLIGSLADIAKEAEGRHCTIYTA